MVNKMVREVLNTSYSELEKVNPILVLSQELPLKILFLHGLSDAVVD